MFFLIYLAYWECGPLRKNRNGPQPKVAEYLGKHMGNEAKLKIFLII